MGAGQKAAWLLLGVGSGVLVASAWSRWMKGENATVFLTVGIALVVVSVAALAFVGLRRDKD